MMPESKYTTAQLEETISHMIADEHRHRCSRCYTDGYVQAVADMTLISHGRVVARCVHTLTTFVQYHLMPWMDTSDDPHPPHMMAIVETLRTRTRSQPEENK